MQNISLQKVAHFLLIFTLIGGIMYYGQTIIVPILFAIFFAFMLKPVCDRMERWGFGRLFAVAIATTFLVLIALGLLFFFSTQIVGFLSDLDDLQQALPSLLRKATTKVANFFGVDSSDGIIWIESKAEGMFEAQFGRLAGGVISSLTSLLSIGIILVYLFLLLLYRRPLKNFLVAQARQDRQENAVRMLKASQAITKNYLFGLGLVTLILGTLNTLGLWALGLDKPYLFGYLGGLLAIIPYVGTFIGGALPTLYSAVHPEYAFQPILVMVMYFLVQSLEGNIITPKIVGNQIRLNPLASIFGLIVFGTLWGVAGLILALPLLAVLKVVCDNDAQLKPMGALLGADLYENERIFFTLAGEQYGFFRRFQKGSDSPQSEKETPRRDPDASSENPAPNPSSPPANSDTI